MSVWSLAMSVQVFADPGVSPNTNGLPGMNEARKIVGAILTFGVIAAVAGVAISAGVWALSSHNGNSHYAARGKMGVVVAAAAALLIGGADSIIAFFQSAGQSILNPLDAGRRPAGVTDQVWTSLVEQRRRELLGSLTETVLGRVLHPVEHTALDAALRATTDESPTPTLPRVVVHLLDPPRQDESSTVDELRVDGRAAAHAVRRLVHGDLAGLFDGPSTVTMDSTDPLVSLDLSGVTGSDTLLALVMTCGSAWMEASLADTASESGSSRRWVVYDEAWRIMRQPSLIRRMQSQWKLSRAYGIANLMIIHRLSDLDAVGDAASETRALANGLLADCSTRIVYRQESDQLGATASLLGLTSTERAVLTDLSIGEGLWRVGSRSFRVQHQVTAAEHDRFDTTAAMRG